MLRWTVDEKEDFEYVTNIYENLYPKDSNFRTIDILNYIDSNPYISHINSHYNRNEGSKSSAIKDEAYLSEKNKC